jgi:hypothetical protein
MTVESPYPGLRPFQRGEAHLFFGREEQTDELLRRLQQTRFLAVVGPSGCGKSSLVRAGMIAALETGFMVGAGSRWEFAVMRPGGQPIRRLATALVDKTSFGPRDTADAADALGFLTASLRRGPLGLVEALQLTPLPPGTNLLVLVDQFEEIFRFRREGGGDEADAFVSLLLETAKQREVPVYIVITMRSDFFGDCAVFAGLPEVINDSQFLTPRLSREQREAAIVGPARVFGGDVEPMLVNRLLNEMGSDPDQLPVMQHLLMRMWTYREASASSAAERPGAEAEMRVLLTLQDYEQVGGLRHALSNHADEAYDSLTEGQKKIAELMFRRLSERGEDKRDTRRPTRAGEIASLCDAAIDEVVAVVDVFRAPGVSFLMPAWPEAIASTNTLDISHESLIRQWERLKEWAREEAESAERYRFLEQTARLWRDGKAALWGRPNLDLALDWKKREKPTAVWAERYGGDFATAMAFLEASDSARLREEAKKRARRHAEVRRLRYATAALAVSLVTLAGGAVFYWYGWVRPHESYYNTMLKRWGKPEGYGELRADQVGRRAVSLKFIRNNGWFGEVDRVEAVDRSGNCTHQHYIGTYLEYAPDVPSPMRECAWEFIYGHDDQVVYEKAYNKFEELVWGFAYVPATKGAPVRLAYFVGPDGFPQPRRNSKAEIVRFEYDVSTGDELRVTYLDRDRLPQQALDQAYGRKHEYYDNGLFRQIISLDDKGQPMNDTFGNAYLDILSYDKYGNILRARALDKSKNSVYFIGLGYHEDVAEYDEDGNRIAVTYFDTSGQKTLQKEGYHRLENEYDNRGNVIAEAYFGIDGRPVMSSYGYHRITIEYDDRGNRIARALFDIEGEPARHADGYHRWTNQYDDHGNVVAEAYFESDGRPAVYAYGYHRMTIEYDERGNVVANNYFDAEGEPTTHADGYHRLTNEYDDRGNLVAGAYFDVDGRPTAHSEGYHRWTNEYDDRGNAIAEAYFDVEGRPASHSDGYHSIIIEYNDRGKAIARMYFNVSGRPTVNADGYHRWTNEYDERGNVVASAYFDASGRPMLLRDGYHHWTAEYDNRDRKIAEAYFDIENQPTLHSSSYHRWTNEYDARGNVVASAYFDKAGRPTANADGYHLLTTEYDDRGKAIAGAYFDVDGRRMMHSDGYHRWTNEYDHRGKAIAQAYYDIDGRPALHADGYHRRTNRYDDRGNTIEGAYFDGDGRPAAHRDGYHRWTNEYDDRGNAVAAAYFDADGRPTVGADGYHRWTNRYDDRSNAIEGAYFDIEGRPVPSTGGFHRWIYAYDGHGSRVTEAYFDVAGGPAVHPNGYHRRTNRYDGNNRLIEEAYYGRDQQLLLHPEQGYAMVRLRYDESGNTVEGAFYGADGELMLHPQYGHAIVRKDYREDGHLIEEAFYGPDQNLLLHPEHGYAMMRMKYDEDGQLIQEAYYGPDEKLLLHPERGYAMARLRYDDRGNMVEGAFYGADGELMLHPEYGHAIVRRQYDEGGRLIEEAFYGTDEKLLLHSQHGYAIARNEYDDRGNRIVESYYDVDGYHRVYEYDDRGNRVAEAYFDAKGQPAGHPSGGYHRWRAEYDDGGNRMAESYFGLDGYHWVYRNDERGNAIASAYFDPEGRPAEHADGYHRWAATYDDAGNQLERAYYDKSGSKLEVAAKVIDVIPDSRAESIGLMTGDLILRYAGKDIHGASQFVREVAIGQGPKRELIIWRDNQTLTFQVEPGRLGVEINDVVAPTDKKLELLLPAAE